MIPTPVYLFNLQLSLLIQSIQKASRTNMKLWTAFAFVALAAAADIHIGYRAVEKVS